MLQHLDKYHIVLASQSPRRQELMRGLGISYEIKTIDVEEAYPESLAGMEIPAYLAGKKAGAYSVEGNDMIIAADTIVWNDNTVLGKPADRADAVQMLEALSGRTHEVITGVCIRTKNRQKTFTVVSKVRFAVLTPEEIDYYIETYRPYDKAGAYGVQEWIGYIGVEYIEGSFYNIMGLPVQRLYSELKKWED